MVTTIVAVIAFIAGALVSYLYMAKAVAAAKAAAKAGLSDIAKKL